MKFKLIAVLASVFVFFSCEKNAVTSITINETEVSMTLGSVDSLVSDAKFTGNITPLVIWKSSNTSIVTVDEGRIEALKVGTAIITATAGDKSVTCTVTVSDQIHPVLAKGELWYYGDVYSSDKSNSFTAYIVGSTINLSDMTGDGDLVFLEFNTGLQEKTALPSGTYTMVADIDKTLFVPFTLVPGYVDDVNNFGCWYFGRTANDIVSGKAVVNRTNEIYNIVYDFKDYYGNTISGTYNGALEYVNSIQNPVEVKRKNAMKRLNAVQR